MQLPSPPHLGHFRLQSPPPSDAAPISSPPQQHPLRALSPPHLLSYTASFLFPSTTPFLSFPLPSPASFLHSSARALPVPSDSPAPALFRRPSGSPASILFGPQCPLSFRYRSTKQDRKEGLRLVLFGQTEDLRSVMFSRMEGHGRTKALCSAKQDQTEALRSALFGRTIPEGRGVLGAGAKKLGKGTGREHVSGSGRRVLEKREEMKERGVVPRRGKG